MLEVLDINFALSSATVVAMPQSPRSPVTNLPEACYALSSSLLHQVC